ncbi:hypothetical protein EJ110_NYTH55358 [Nymphaea thermarum]|nr:hypothetical protein EJ110_NYTH55358 [Nymphaea thermarum]
MGFRRRENLLIANPWFWVALEMPRWVEKLGFHPQAKLMENLGLPLWMGIASLARAEHASAGEKGGGGFSAIATLAGGAGKGRLDYNFIFACLRSQWSGMKDIRFTSVGKGMFLIRTSSDDDLQLVLSPGKWYVGGRLLIANQWHPGMPMRIESSNRVQIWIRLPDLPVEWWNHRIFTDIAEIIGGTFVEADEFTKHLQRFGFAHLKVEIPLGFNPIPEIELEVSGGKMFVQSIEYETKVKYCQKCGSTAHFEGSCLATEEHKEGDQRPVNTWHLVKTTKRRPQPFKGVTEMRPKLNKFEALSTMVEELVDGDSIRGRACEKVSGSERETVQDAGKSMAGYSSQAGGQEPHQPVKVKRSDLNPLALHDKAQLVDKVKKRSLKHKEVNGSKKRTSPPNVNDNPEQAGGRSQEVEDLNMVGTEGGYQEGSSLEDMEVGFEEGPLQPDAMEDDKVVGPATNSLATIAFAIDTKLNEAQLQKFQLKIPDKHLISNIIQLGPWARIIAIWDPAEVTLLNCIPIICMGDFNAVLNSNEKTGKPPALQACLALSSFVAQSALTEELAGYRDQVDSAWAVDLRGCAMIKLIHKLEATRDQLKSWCKGGANNLSHLIGEIKSKIRLRQTLSERGQIEAIEQECSLKRELTKLLILEERLWRQKPRMKWMRDGDLNTKFFQGIANGRRRRNRIETISHEGLILTDTSDIFSACTDYFIALLGTSHGDGSLPQSLAMGPKVTSEENADLPSEISFCCRNQVGNDEG